ncbi:GMC family oxidoreductase N-terminal domain-containing protein [Sphingomonas sp. CGMCC 1.13654]|uniref:GMC family oxidoreductase N-terminal domain-containing protein n=1 Tax=Sphingomonas chungangi TaxID=2683589 RepID=A0A838L5K4_9SPHN|nr:GMC family oxidoreductase N-terminal domain-containing protein [Sphingomonas chungangi]MVW55070.1 glucose-methanol-choline oxidoreductase [Sphingomonas chungangi]
MSDYDYVIVGAGAAGCVLAYRLSADPATRVLLVEAGGSDAHPFITMPKGLGKILFNPRYLWPFMTEPEAVSNHVGESWARGRVLGGSTAVNGMVWVHGEAANYEKLAGLAGEDWRWEHIAKAYRELEGHQLGAGPVRGGKGPLRISLSDYRTKLTEAMIAAGEALGLKREADVNDPQDGERIGYAPRTIWRGRRVTAATAFLRPARRRRNLTVVTGVVVDRIAVENGRAVAVLGTKDGETVRYVAKREVLLCGGTIASPAILQRSGIGPAEHLRSLGITVVHDAPGIGANLSEHRGIVMQWKVADALSQNASYRGARLVRSVLRYFAQHKGPMTGGAYDMGAWFKTSPDQPIPDGQMLMSPYSFDYNATSLRVEPFGGFNICVYKLRPDSRGSILIRSTNPADLPTITARYAADERDQASVPMLVRYARRYVAQAPLGGMVIEETRPGAQFASDDEIFEAYRRFGYGNYHACGTCRMGSDAASVVDGALKVRGIDGLRVVDASVFPFMLAGNTQAPVMAIAWRAADILLRGEK